MPATSAPDPSPGRRFVLVRILGEGTFGSVYLADMEGAGGFRRKVALKVLNANWDPESDAGRRLRDEARLLGRLQHRNIVRVDDLIRLNGRWALVMEYIRGADLETLWEQARDSGVGLPPRAVAEAGAAIASALLAAYRSPGDNGQPLCVVHRDIKPSNVRMSENGDVKVLDFGVARAEFTGREAKTERVRYGSLGYMAPERILGEDETPAGDVYALAVVLWELFTIRTFGRAELGLDKQAAQVAQARALLLEGGLPEALADLIASGLAYAPLDRPTAGEMDTRLRQLARDLPGDDLHTLARTRLPSAGRAEEQDDVGGTVMEEAEARSVVMPQTNSATLALPADEETPPEPKRAPMLLTVAAGVAIAGALLVAVWLTFAPGRTVVSPSASTPSASTPSATPPSAPPPSASAPPPIATVPPVAVAAAAALPAAALPAVPLPPAVAPPAATSPPAGTTARPKQDPVVTGVAREPAPEAATIPIVRLRAAKFTLSGAEGLRVTCGDVSASGSMSLVLRDVPAGSCTVAVGDRRTTVVVDSPRGVDCSIVEDALKCR